MSNKPDPHCSNRVWLVVGVAPFSPAPAPYHGGVIMILHVIKNLFSGNSHFENSSGEEESSGGEFDLDLTLDMILLVAFILLYLLLAVLYLWVGVNHKKIHIKLTLKCLPLISLILWYTIQWSIGVGLCEEGVRGTRVESKQQLFISVWYR